MVLALVVAGVTIWLLAAGVPTVCRDAVAGDQVVRVCEPMDVTDVRVWVFALLLALLVFPELSELELGGVITLRRRLAELREDATDLRSELAHIRTQAHAAAQASAATRSDIHVDVRQEQTGAALAEVGQRADGPFDRDEEAGAYRQLALTAGLVGLTQLFLVGRDQTTLVGFTLGDDGGFEATHFTSGVTDDELRVVSELVDEARVSGTTVTAQGEGLDAVALAVVDGRVVGALALLVRGGAAVESHQLDEVGAALQVAAAAYSRLLVDLVGEGAGRGGGG